MGSGAAGGLTMQAKRTGNKWVLNGQKKWIGNATFADVIVIWARDVDSNDVKGFLVRKGNAGLHVEKMQDKMALRIVQNGLITLTDCEVDESDRLQKANNFKDRQCIAHDPRQCSLAGCWLRTRCIRKCP